MHGVWFNWEFFLLCYGGYDWETGVVERGFCFRVRGAVAMLDFLCSEMGLWVVLRVRVWARGGGRWDVGIIFISCDFGGSKSLLHHS